MKTLIVYKSKTGFTKRYAQWISEEMKCSMMPYDEFTTEHMQGYDRIVYGGRVHVGKVEGFQKFIKMLKDSNKEIIVFAVGGTASEAKETVDEIWAHTLSTPEVSKLPHFYMQGGLDYEKMSRGDRFIMKSLARMLQKKNEKSADESGCEQAIQDSYDATKKEAIEPIVTYLKSLG